MKQALLMNVKHVFIVEVNWDLFYLKGNTLSEGEDEVVGILLIFYSDLLSSTSSSLRLFSVGNYLLH